MIAAEIAEMDLRVQLIGAVIEASQKKGLSQRKPEELSGVKQPIIARMEKGSTSPQLSTFLKLLCFRKDSENSRYKARKNGLRFF